MKTVELHNKVELLTKVARGDEKSFAVLFHCYRNKIYSVAYRLTESTFLAEEVVQDIFLKLWLKRETLTEIKDFENYLFIMARNHVFSALKSSARQQSLVDHLIMETPSSENSTYNKIINQEYEQILQQAVDLLPTQQKQIYLLSKEQELKREEIAKLLHISSETVKTHLSRALRHIRAYSISKLEIQISVFVFFLEKLI